MCEAQEVCGASSLVQPCPVKVAVGLWVHLQVAFVFCTSLCSAQLLLLGGMSVVLFAQPGL